MSVEVGSPAASDPEQPQWLKIEGKVYLADYESLNTIEEMFSATHKEKKLPIQWETTQTNTFRFVIDSILRNNESSEIILNWSSSYYSPIS